jgi:hypothetical protein
VDRFTGMGWAGQLAIAGRLTPHEPIAENPSRPRLPQPLVLIEVILFLV